MRVHTRPYSTEGEAMRRIKKTGFVLREKPEEVQGCLVLAEAAVSSSGASRQIKRS